MTDTTTVNKIGSLDLRAKDYSNFLYSLQSLTYIFIQHVEVF